MLFLPFHTYNIFWLPLQFCYNSVVLNETTVISFNGPRQIKDGTCDRSSAKSNSQSGFFLTIIRLSQYQDGLQFNLKFVRESIADSYLLIIWRHQRHVSYWYYLAGLLENTTKTKGYSLYLETKHMLLAVKTSQCNDLMYTLLISLYLAF